MTKLRTYTSNAVETTLTTGILYNSTALTVVNNSGYLTEYPFTIKVADEAILVGGSSGNTFNNLTRGYDGTVAVAHSSGETVQHAAIGDDFRNRWIDVKTVRPGGTLDDEFGADTKDSAWVEITPTGTATWTQQNGVMSVLGSLQTASDFAALVKPLPVLPAYEISTAVRWLGARDNYLMVGLILTDGTSVTSNCVSAFMYTTSTAGQYLASQRVGTVTNASAVSSSDVNLQLGGPWLHIKMRWRTLNVFDTLWSSDGVSWGDLGLSDIAATFTPTHAGVCFSTWGSGTEKIATYEYFRGNVTA